MTKGFFAGSYGGDNAKLTDATRLECKICWYVYDPRAGDDYWQIPTGTPFAKLPDHWTCPNCDGDKSGFLVLDEEDNDACAHAIAERLEAAFKRIHVTRMEGVPILNPRLEVEAVGTREWNGHWLVVLITPWFINMMLLAQTQEQSAAWSALPLGTTVMHRFPAGRFDFLVGDETDLGRYQMCSLFSPVLEFEHHAAARVVASTALDALFDASLDPAAVKEASDEPPIAKPTAAQADERATTPQFPARPSRRGFLSGKILPGEGVP